MKNAIINYYENYNEDVRLLRDKAHSIEFLTTIRYFDKLFPKGDKVLDACAGTGIYSFYLAERGYKVTAGDLVPYNVSLIEKRQAVTPLLENIYTGNVVDLAMFEDERGFKYGFYGSTPEEIKDIMSAAGLEQICNIGTDGIRNGIERKINNSSDEDFEKWLEYHYATCEAQSISGYSLHGLYFGRKV